MGATLNKPTICFLAFREFKTENHPRPHCLATKTGALSLLIGFIAAFRRVAPSLLVRCGVPGTDPLEPLYTRPAMPT